MNKAKHDVCLLAFPGQAKANYLVVKGQAYQYPLKIILPANFPMEAPRIYFDMQMDVKILNSLSYVNQQSKCIETDLVKQWRSNYTLEQVVTEACTSIAFRPPTAS